MTTTIILAQLLAPTAQFDLKQTLTEALTEEYLAHATYDAILVHHGSKRPFSNIVKSEAQHIKVVSKLFTDRDWSVPADTYRRKNQETDADYTKRLNVPKNWTDALKLGLKIENEDVKFLSEALKQKELPQDVRRTFDQLLLVSRDRHAVAFERAIGKS